MKDIQIKMIPISPKTSFSQDTTKLFVLLNDAVRDEAAEDKRVMTQYPPAPAGSRYRRTGMLRNSWGFQMESGGGHIAGIIFSSSNIAPYNKDVQGENQQPLFEAIGWRSINDLIEIVSKSLPQRIERMMKKVFG